MNSDDQDYLSQGDRETRGRTTPLGVLSAGQAVGRFILVEQLGYGGMGQAWKAVDPNRQGRDSDGFVVLKFLPDALRFNPDATADFREEYVRVQSLHHRHICPLYDIGDEAGFGSFQVMLFLPGQTLRSFVREHDSEHVGLPLERVVALLSPVSEALDYAHGCRLIHRDVKPENIIHDSSSGDVHLIDFGLAARVRTSMSRYSQERMSASGTEAYMAPEQWMGGLQNAASDLWGLAVVAWELLTGELPFHGDGHQLGFAVCQAPLPVLPSSQSHLRAVFDRALHKDRDSRFESCSAFLTALQSASSSSTPASSDARSEPSPSVKGPVAEADPPRVSTGEVPTTGKASRSRTAGPSLLESPFDGSTAKRSQDAWADHLGIDVELTTSAGINFRLIPPGSFLMGSPKSEAKRRANEEQHHVTISEPFLMGVYPVTQGEWTSVMGSNPSRFSDASGQDTDRFPVERVSWDDAEKFLARLNKSHGMNGYQYRLPTEAEWEYACRAGTATAYSFGANSSNLGEYAWFGDNSGNQQIDALSIWFNDRDNYSDRLLANECRSHSVGQKKPNPWGLYDLHGNVLEWCSDWYGDFSSKPITDPSGPASGSSRVLRGGSWCNLAESCRSANRNSSGPSVRVNIIGFRVVCAFC